MICRKSTCILMRCSLFFHAVLQRQLYALIAVCFISTLIISCVGRKNDNVQSGAPKSEGIVTIAERYSLNKTDSCTILTINDPWQGAAGIKHTYYLINRNNEVPLKVDPSEVIYIPVQKIICMSTTHLAMLAALNERHTIAGVSGTGYIFDEKITAMIEAGLINDIGYESGLNNELIIRISPDLIMLYGIGSESAAYIGKLRELGTQALFNADYLEEDPLGKAEWIKLFGALFCKEKMADSIFTSVVASYDQIKEYVKQNAGEIPDVLLGLPFRDAWYISPGNSYISRLIEDAGGSYLWHDTESSVSMPYGLEDVFMRSLEADYWLNTGIAGSKKEIASIDQRLKNLPCFINGNLYNNNKRISPEGGNDYWESGALYPDLILKDIATILHPELFRNRELYYYRKIE